MPYKDPEVRREYNRSYHQQNRHKHLPRMKRYYQENRGKALVEAKRYRQENAEKINVYLKGWRLRNKGYAFVKNREYYQEHKEEIAVWGKHYRKQNRKKIRAYNDCYERKKQQESPSYRIKILLRKRILIALKGRHKSANTEELVGGVDNARARIESLWRPGMTWENHGDLWEIDHIRPLSSFDLTDSVQWIAFHYSNLQPLYKWENREKRDRLDWERAA